MGSDDGLYVVSFKHGKPVHIIGLGTVYQLQIVRDLGIALLVVGKERELCYIDVYDLESRLKQLQMGANLSAINAQQIEKIKACHLFIVQKVCVTHFCLDGFPSIGIPLDFIAGWL